MILDEYLVSVDGGGTKTVFCAYNLSASSKHYFTSGSTNYKTIGEAAARENLTKGFHDIVRQLKVESRQIKGCVLGLAGCDSETDYQIFANMLAPLGIDSSRIYMCNDAELAFYESGHAPGIVIISGTGSIVYGFDALANKCRSGGWGAHISDLGSGYWIGAQVIQDALLYCDGCRGHEKIFDRIRDYFQVENFDEFPYAVTDLKVFEIAAVAKTVIGFAEEGDTFSMDIIDAAVSHLAVLAYSVYCKLDFSKADYIDMVLAGGVFNSKFLRTQIEEKLIRIYKMNNLHFVPTASKPVDGGMRIAIERFVNKG